MAVHHYQVTVGEDPLGFGLEVGERGLEARGPGHEGRLAVGDLGVVMKRLLAAVAAGLPTLRL